MRVRSSRLPDVWTKSKAVSKNLSVNHKSSSHFHLNMYQHARSSLKTSRKWNLLHDHRSILDPWTILHPWVVPSWHVYPVIYWKMNFAIRILPWKKRKLEWNDKRVHQMPRLQHRMRTVNVDIAWTTFVLMSERKYPPIPSNPQFLQIVRPTALMKQTRASALVWNLIVKLCLDPAAYPAVVKRNPLKNEINCLAMNHWKKWPMWIEEFN